MKQWLLTICVMLGTALLTSQLAQASENNLDRREAEIQFAADHLGNQIKAAEATVKRNFIEMKALENIPDDQKNPQEWAQYASLCAESRNARQKLDELYEQQDVTLLMKKRLNRSQLRASPDLENFVAINVRLESNKLGSLGSPSIVRDQRALSSQ